MRRLALTASMLGLISLVACFKPGPAPIGGAVTIELSSSSGTLPVIPGGSATITATIYDQSNQGVTWTMVPVNFGSLSAPTSTSQSQSGQALESVTYTAPSNFSAGTTVTITATSISNPYISTSIGVKLSPIGITLQVFSPVTNTQVQTAYSQSVGPGQQLTLLAALLPSTVTTTSQPVSWTLAPADAGSLINPIPLAGEITYVAPATVSSPITATVTATVESNPNATASMRFTVLPSGAGPNVAIVNVDGGPVPTQIYPNGAFTSVTICNPESSSGATACQVVDGVLIDTGSYGLRILQAQIPRLNLPTLIDPYGNVLENCDSLADGSYLWGPVSLGDVYIAGDVGASVPIQVISSTNAVVPDGCSNGGTTELNTPQLLGANGILGIGPEPTDCTVAGVNYCDGSTQAVPPNLYYSCPSVGCMMTDSPVTVAAVQQVSNPASLFRINNLSGVSNENTGIVVQLPGVSGSAPSAMGTLTFVSTTELNNQLGNATVFTLDSNDHFTTIFNSQTLTNSFIDSGSNALYFPDSLTVCADKTQFFCPSSLTSYSAVAQGATQGQNTVNFSVDNADSLLSTSPTSAAFSTLAGPEGTYNSCSGGNISCVFDWGLPFFYGRTVFSHTDACTSAQTSCDPMTGAWWAY
ncbi:MAG TPA: DUF3443 family protein [Verrucomicrobiae bacterium]|nr:DUF3443 family protein [Verrucomicrobiae bacterium]